MNTFKQYALMGMFTAVSLLGTPLAAAKPTAAEVLAEGANLTDGAEMDF